MKKQTYTIAFAEARREYLSNESFREVLNTGCFMYVENSFVINSDKFVVLSGDGYSLTEYARLHLDECALLFEELEIINYSGFATRGEDNQEADIKIKRSTSYTTKKQKRELDDEIKQLRMAMIRHYDLHVANQKTCWQRIYEIVSGKGTKTSGQFAIKTGLGSKVFDRAKNNVASMPDVKTIVTIAAAYNLDFTTTEELLRLAGHSFSPVSKEHDCYRFIIMTMHDYEMDAKNTLLEEEGFDPLGTKPQKERALRKQIARF